MDPNETLAAIRALCFRWMSVPMSNEEAADDMEALVEAVSNLDNWIQVGGFLPSDWSKS